MDICEAIRQRKTIRDFEDMPIPAEILHKIIETGMLALSNNHLREWEFIVILDRTKKWNSCKISESCETPAISTAYWMNRK